MSYEHLAAPLAARSMTANSTAVGSPMRSVVSMSVVAALATVAACAPSGDGLGETVHAYGRASESPVCGAVDLDLAPSCGAWLGGFANFHDTSVWNAALAEHERRIGRSL